MVISQLFYLVARRPKNLINIKQSDTVSPESHIEAVMKLGETDEPFQHLNFYDGWWKIMIIEETRLWLA